MNGTRPPLLSDLGEFGFIDRVRRRYGGPVRRGETGIGDDAAVLPGRRGDVVLSTDLLVEGTHFDLRTIRPQELGRRAVAANLSDLAAMGSVPVGYLAAVAAPARSPLSLLDGLFRGMARAARPAGLRLLGGDTCRGERLVLSLTVAGRVAPGGAILRSGARPGDLLYVTGEPGWSHLGLRLLARGRPPRPSGWARTALSRHLTPEARWREGIAAAKSGAVAAMIDLSDGLLPDLAHVLRAAGAGAVLDEASFPITPPFRRAAAALGVDPLAAFLAGGEDYELLMAVRPGRVAAFLRSARSFPAGAFPVGAVTGRKGIVVRTRDGRRIEGSDLPRGFSHFPPRAGG